MITFKTLENTAISNLTNVFNEAFSDYFVPFKLSEQQLQSKFEAENICLSLSIGAFDGNILVGFIFHCLDIRNGEKFLYNSGTGVIPTYRSKGLTTKMYLFIIPYLKKEKISEIELEVLSQNIQAIKSYQKIGFLATRKLMCFKGKVQILKSDSKLITMPLNLYDWSKMKTFWDFDPTWQNSIRTVESLINSNFSIGAFINDQLIGYVIFNPNSKRIQQIAIKKTERNKGFGKKLISEVIENFGNEIGLINIDSQHLETVSFLEKIGLENYVNQIEMKLISFD